MNRIGRILDEHAARPILFVLIILSEVLRANQMRGLNFAISLLFADLSCETTSFQRIF